MQLGAKWTNRTAHRREGCHRHKEGKETENCTPSRGSALGIQIPIIFGFEHQRGLTLQVLIIMGLNTWKFKISNLVLGKLKGHKTQNSVLEGGPSHR